jgi:hypothetical protein
MTKKIKYAEIDLDGSSWDAFKTRVEDEIRNIKITHPEASNFEINSRLTTRYEYEEAQVTLSYERLENEMEYKERLIKEEASKKSTGSSREG